jgi:hypothetical protein
MIAALFVETNGHYYGLDNVDPWDIERDARKYEGPYSVVAHPPCNLWTKFARINYKRWGGEHNKPGNDSGCFASALRNIKRCSGVLEHPAFSYAWDEFRLPMPSGIGWTHKDGYWVCEVWQSAYGHLARKRTWLLYCGPAPFDLRWIRPSGTHQIGFHDQRGKGMNKLTLSGKAASRTPVAFRDELIRLAIHARTVTP